MSDKSHVGMGHNMCPVCGTRNNETVLLDRRLKPTLSRDNFTGWALCPEHQAQADNGFVFLIELKSEPTGKSLESTWPLRTGLHIAIRREVAESIGLHIPSIGFCAPDLTAKLQSMMEPE